MKQSGLTSYRCECGMFVNSHFKIKQGWRSALHWMSSIQAFSNRSDMLVWYAYVVRAFPLPEQFVVNVSPNPASNLLIGTTVELNCFIFIFPMNLGDEVTIRWEKFNESALCNPPNCMRRITLTDIDVGSEGLYRCIVTVGDREETGETFLTTVGESKRKGMSHFSPIICCPNGYNNLSHLVAFLFYCHGNWLHFSYSLLLWNIFAVLYMQLLIGDGVGMKSSIRLQ